MESKNLGQWLQQIAGGITVITGFIAGLVGFAQLVQGEAGLVTLLLLSLGIGLVWLTCLYFARFWQPEKQDKVPRGIQPSPTAEQEQALARRVRQRKAVRWSAKVGLVLVPLLVVAGSFGWRHVQSLPSKEVVILVAEFAGPKGPEGQDYGVTANILNRLYSATRKYSDVRVEALKEPVTEPMDRDAALELGEDRKASIVIWGSYNVTGTDAQVSVNFEVLQPPEYLPEFGDTARGDFREFPKIEIERFQLQKRTASEMAYLTLFTLGVARYAAEDWDEAIARFNDALEQTQSPTPSLDKRFAHHFIGNAYNSKADYERAIKAFKAALAIKPDFLEALYNKGVALGKLERYEEAIAVFDIALRFNPDYPDALNGKGVALNRLKRYEDAIVAFNAALNAALKIKKDYPKAHNNKGIALSNLGRYEDAIDAFDDALDIDPDYPYALNNKGVALNRLKRYKDAIVAFKAALDIDSDYPDALNNKGIALSNLERYKDAIGAFDAALAIKPDYPDALNNKGIALGNLGRYEDAIVAFKAALAIKPDYPDALNNKGIALGSLERYKDAIVAFDAALALNPDYPNALKNKGVALNRLKRYEDAIVVFKAALDIHPDYPDALNNKGIALGNLGRYKDAINAFDAALALNPDYPNALYHKARVYALQGKVKPALDALDKAIQLNPDEYRKLAKTDTAFDSIRDDPRFKALITSKWWAWLNSLASIL